MGTAQAADLGCLYGGLKALTEDYLSRVFTRDDGAAMHIERCLIDANWGQSTEVVYQFCREARFANVILPPSHGKYIGASLTQTLKKPALSAGLGAVSVVSPVAGVDAPRHASASSDEAEADAW